MVKSKQREITKLNYKTDNLVNNLNHEKTEKSIFKKEKDEALQEIKRIEKKLDKMKPPKIKSCLTSTWTLDSISKSTNTLSSTYLAVMDVTQDCATENEFTVKEVDMQNYINSNTLMESSKASEMNQSLLAKLEDRKKETVDLLGVSPKEIFLTSDEILLFGLDLHEARSIQEQINKMCEHET